MNEKQKSVLKRWEAWKNKNEGTVWSRKRKRTEARNLGRELASQANENKTITDGLSALEKVENEIRV